MSNILADERSILESHFPGLDDSLASHGIEFLEKSGSLAMGYFQSSGLAMALIPRDLGGAGVSPVDFIKLQCAIASRAPAFAIATCMHHYKLAAVISEARTNPSARYILEKIADDRAILGSGGAESQIGGKLYKPSTTLREEGGELYVTGHKKPCSLSNAMTFLSTMVRGEEGGRFGDQLLHLFIDVNQPGVNLKPFWTNPVLMACENNEVVLDKAVVQPNMVLPLGASDSSSSFALASYGWFELGGCSAYRGVLAALIEYILLYGNPPAASRGKWAISLGTLSGMLSAIAEKLTERPFDEELLAQMFHTRFSFEKLLLETALDCFSHLSGISYGTTTLPLLLVNICLALQFHPPRRHTIEANLGDALISGKLVLA